jgi:hypothetical protein
MACLRFACVGLVLGVVGAAGCGGSSPAASNSDGGGGKGPDGGAGTSGAAGTGAAGTDADSNAAAGMGDAPVEAVKPTTEQGMFTALGVDTTASPRTYVDRKMQPHTLGDKYNPLGRGTRSLRPLAEVYFAGRTPMGGTGNQFLLDDRKNHPTTTSLTVSGADTFTANTFLHSVAADLDGDGIDEVVNVYWIEASKELHANVVRCTDSCTGNGGTFSIVKDSKLLVTDGTKKPLGRDWFSHGLAAADTDGDGRMELVVANFGGIDVCAPQADWTFSCANKSANASQKMSLARAHLDDNPEKANDDLVVAWSDGALAYVSIYDGTPTAFADNAFTNKDHDPTPLSVKFVGETTVTSYAEAFVAAGDFDLDGRDEILLGAGRAGTNPMTHDLVLMDDALVSYRFFKAFRVDLGASGGQPLISFGLGGVPNPRNNLFRPALTVFTKRNDDGGLEKAIYAGAFIIDDLGKIHASDTATLATDDDLTNKVGKTFMGYYETGGGGYNHAPWAVVAGDLDGTMRDTLVALWDQTNEDTGNKSAFTPPTLAKLAFDTGTGKWPRWTNFVTTTGGMAPTTGEYDGTYGDGLALPNVDRDSPVVQYLGKHELLFSSPRVLAVLAAAPYFAGVNGAGSSTSISFGKGSGYGNESTIGVSAGVSIGYEAPNVFGTTKASWKLSFGFAMDWISTTIVSLTETKTWTAGNEDAVVFQVIPFDVYYYRVVSSPDPADFAKPLSINVPRKLSTYKVPVSLYNASILNGPTIPATLLNHEVGKPATYPKVNACAGATGGGKFGDTDYLVDKTSWCFASSSTSHVGVGTGSVGFTISRTMMSTASVKQDYSVDFEAEAGAGGFVAGISAGFHWGYGYSVDASQSYSFAGTVADLPDTTHGYDLGLMAHKGMLTGLNTSYPVFLVDYWVENVN